MQASHRLPLSVHSDTAAVYPHYFVFSNYRVYWGCNHIHGAKPQTTKPHELHCARTRLEKIEN